MVVRLLREKIEEQSDESECGISVGPSKTGKNRR